MKSSSESYSRSPNRKIYAGSHKGPTFKNHLDDHHSHISSMNSKDTVIDEEVE